MPGPGFRAARPVAHFTEPSPLFGLALALLHDLCPAGCFSNPFGFTQPKPVFVLVKQFCKVSVDPLHCHSETP
jgi:hypothetical protein